MVRRIIDDLINTLDFRNKSEIAASDTLSSIVSGLSESETENKQKNQGRTWFSIDHMKWKVLGNILCDLDPKVNVI